MLADAEDVALSFEQNHSDPNQLVKTDKVRHPIALGFHMLFRISAVVLFLLSDLFSKNFITIFVSTILLLSMDFWTVKNITGRLLVGLRWWNHVDDEGKSHWIYENRKNNPQDPNTIVVESSTESRLFWISLVLTQLIWSVFFLISIFTFSLKSLTIISVAFVLNGSNLYGFLKCKFGTNEGITNVASNFFKRQVFKSVFQRATQQMMSQVTPNNSNNNNQSADQMIPK